MIAVGKSYKQNGLHLFPFKKLKSFSTFKGSLPVGYIKA